MSKPQKKYYIRKFNKQFGTTEYKRYKCVDGFCADPALCWKFSRAGALKIIEDLKREYHGNIDNLVFDMVEAKVL